MSRQKELVRELFDREASKWTDWAYDPDESFDIYPTGKARLAVIRRELERFMPDKKARLIDAGCGGGDIAMALEGEGHSVHGVDFAPSMIQICRDRYEAAFPGRGDAALRFQVADVEDFALRGEFDGAYAVGLLEYLESDQPLLGALCRHVAPGGVVMVECRNRLFNALSGNAFTLAEARSDHLGALAAELDDVARFSPVQAADIPSRVVEMGERIAKLPSFATLRDVPRDLGIQFHADIARRMFTPAQIEREAAQAGLRLRHVIYYHLHLLSPRLEASLPRFFNALAMAAQPLGETPAGAFLGTCFLAVMEKVRP
ncbi:MAG: class I SAM-dependent methyltransferase [Alphaproteobacteria bacterium]|nr:class I SAM-dependent methyltransferase [Alphaproteobacteria bacterium]MBF0332471.1 class I SAM-dependent methyltransferase [Alphaproteobacteria bacterium]